MKKVFLAVLVAGLFVACNSKTTNEEVTDSTDQAAIEQPAVDTPQQVAETTPAPAETTPAAEPKKDEPKVKVEANEDGATVKVGKKAEISVQPKQTKGNNF